MDFPAVYEAMVTCGGSPPFATRVQQLRRHFEERTGAFGPEDAWFEARSGAFWDDALTTPGFAAQLASTLQEQGIHHWTGPLERAHRGLFHPEPSEFGWRLIDGWSGAEFVVTPSDPGLHEALRAATVLDGRVVARMDPLEIALLPGAIFHPADATEPIARVLAAARDRGMSAGETLDALLRMERNLRSLSRVRASYAYRPENLAAPRKSSQRL